MKGEVKKYSVNNLCVPAPLRAIISRKGAKNGLSENLFFNSHSPYRIAAVVIHQ